jgi:membrane-bound metal-dependent hydrolase YbcI (DUF457 family)
MYVGHFASGLALKAAEPKAPTWALLLGVGFLDILFGPFLMAGIEHASLTPDISPGFSLDYIDWSHSLLMALVWSFVFASFFLTRGKAVAGMMGLAVFSHFLLDLPMHPSDMALWPGSSIHLGFGLWRSLPTGWWFVELAVIAAGWGYYAWKSRSSKTYGGRPLAMGVALLALHLFNSPWLSTL